MTRRKTHSATTAVVVESPPEAYRVERASWLADDTLLAFVRVPPRMAEMCAHGLAGQGAPSPIEILYTPCPVPPYGDDWFGRLVVLRYTAPSDVPDPGARGLRPGARRTPDLGTIDGAVTDLRTLARETLAWLPVEDRIRVMDFLAGLATSASPRSWAQLSESLHTLREALRERQPLALIARDEPQGLHIDSLFALTDTAFYIRGWLRDADGGVCELTAIAPEGQRADLLPRVFWHRRPDLDEFYSAAGQPGETRSVGFICYFELGSPSRRADGWVVEMRSTAGSAVESSPHAARFELGQARDSILGDLRPEPVLDEELVRNHTSPALLRMQESRKRAVQVETIEQYGSCPTAPEVTVVVVLPQRNDLLEHQLAQFAHDPSMYLADLVYVVASPKPDPSLSITAAHLHELYRVPFRVISVRDDGAGCAAGLLAAGVDHARAPLLTFLSCFALPVQPGWLDRMREFHHAHPRIGALGAKLLYEDDSLQHAGLRFVRPIGSRTWEAAPFFKGLHRDVPAANLTRQVPAVSLECLMISKELFLQVGGIANCYLEGDYRDADLCLRVAAAGYENWYLPEAELYHLEESSQPSRVRKQTARYNAWVFDRLWGEQVHASSPRRYPTIVSP